jgi:hypothetical protein
MSSNLTQEIKRGMALAFFGSAYADQADEAGEPMRGEIMDQLPDEIDSAALHAADTLHFDICRANRVQTLDELYRKAQYIVGLHDDKGDRPLTPELFGHYCAMQAMGCGVGLDSFGKAVYDAIRVPYLEFGSFSLQKDYF